MPQDRMESVGTSQRTPVDTYRAPDIESTLSRAAAVTQRVRVVHGANEQYFDNLEGKTVGSVKKSLREVFNIPGDASALIEGKEVTDDFILEGGMNLEFVKEAGVKGVAEQLADLLFDSERYIGSLSRAVDLLLPLTTQAKGDDPEFADFAVAFKERIMEKAPEMREKSREIYGRELGNVFDPEQQRIILEFLVANPWYVKKMGDLSDVVQPQLHEMGEAVGRQIVAEGLDFQQSLDG